MKYLATVLLNQRGKFRVVNDPRGTFQLLTRIIEKLQWTCLVLEDIDLNRRDMPSRVVLAEKRASEANNREQSEENISPDHCASPRRIVSAGIKQCKLPMSLFKNLAGKKQKGGQYRRPFMH